MAKGALALAATVVLLAIAGQTAFARDRELRAVLESLACVPERIVSNRLSPRLLIYEVTCKGVARVVQVECLETRCRLLVPAREDDDR